MQEDLKLKKQIEEFINPSINDLHDPYKLKKHASRYWKNQKSSFKKRKRFWFLVIMMSMVFQQLLSWLKCLKKLSYKVNFYLPNRFVDGYGLTNDVLDKIKKTYNPNLIITVDCGISCYKEVEYAKTLGIEIIVTDHHEIPEILPNTLVLNAKIAGQEVSF